MAVEARHLTLFPPQLLGNREVMNAIEGNGNLYGQPVGYGMPPLSGTTTETLLPMYGSDSVPAKTAMKSDSGLTYALPVSRKRPRDQSAINPFVSFPSTAHQNPNHHNRTGPFTFLGEDISLQIQQQQLEIDRFIVQHTEKVRLEIEERRKRNSRRIIAAVEDGMMKRLRAKEEEIEKIGKLNWALEERVKSLCVENQIWRDLAQTNEATANALRSNLEHVLTAQVQEENNRLHGGDEAAAALMDDAESCCGSNYNAGGGDNEEPCRGGGERRRWTGMALMMTVTIVVTRVTATATGGAETVGKRSRACCCCRAGISASVLFVGPPFTLAPSVNPSRPLVFMLTCLPE
ncbi:hypothetical protein RJ639_000847 [Escallonia herrerae]|uniref:BOI-related E3 ubiquitin-protein ligase 3 n=1 Tax=Escallonia herrerae TaxID=1293975 RepID=A0AA88XHS2_9ASTE|nr:hypothetical protein RJ639_000847 [Escallonia herrerae]